MDFEEKIKLEPVDDYEPETKEVDPLRDHDYCKKPKLEELVEPKLEESDYFEMDRSSEISPESPIFEYPDYLKLESVDHDGSVWPIQAQTRKTRKCSVCSKVASKEYFIRTRSTNRKFIVILGAVSSGKMSISLAKCLLNTVEMAVCPNHFRDAINAIFISLNINHVDEMHSCSIDKMTTLMETANSLSSAITFSQLADALLNYFQKTGYQREPVFINCGAEKVERKTSSTKVKPVSHRCCMCALISINQSLASITSPKRRVVLMVGAVLSGKKSIEEARSLVSKWGCYICEHHLSEVIDSIFAALNVTNAKCIREMQLCSMDNQKQVMSIVSSLSTAFSFAEFTKLLSIFVQKLYYMRGTVRTNTLHC